MNFSCYRMTLVGVLPLAHPTQCGKLYLANLGIPKNLFKVLFFYRSWRIRPHHLFLGQFFSSEKQASGSVLSDFNELKPS